MFWVKKFENSGFPDYLDVYGSKSVSFDGKVYVFHQPCFHPVPSLSVLNPPELLWRHYNLKMPEGVIVGIATYRGLIYLFIRRINVLLFDPEKHSWIELKVEGNGPDDQDGHNL